MSWLAFQCCTVDAIKLLSSSIRDITFKKFQALFSRENSVSDKQLEIPIYDDPDNIKVWAN